MILPPGVVVIRHQGEMADQLPGRGSRRDMRAAGSGGEAHQQEGEQDSAMSAPHGEALYSP